MRGGKLRWGKILPSLPPREVPEGPPCTSERVPRYLTDRTAGGACRQCRKYRQQLNEDDGDAACSYPEMRLSGFVVRAHDSRPL